jgi:hypothetical protein
MPFSRLAALALLAHLCLAVPSQAADSASAITTPEPARFSLGVGYPDLRVRGQLIGPLDGELKYAFGEGIQAYSGRLYYRAAQIQNFNFTLGAEGGLLSFNGVQSLDGSGSFFGGFAGLEYAFTRRLSLSADFGPAMISAGSGGSSVSGLEWVINTALYFRIF